MMTMPPVLKLGGNTRPMWARKFNPLIGPSMT
jgi:hypothetical protein